ncbi:anaphase-promoting complex subunit 4-like isoform X2 [Daphnia pulex]|uniref:Anaphase-promoting complex subunit 4 n=1 Tax=Daphnia pulicaria TaxID=35523 RepID=A0A4Y7MX96_9CRUS|nr:anaphase-promoting complex subunit 4-like isoform X2 [Daphnia pulex]SVE85340.1 EOG090X01H4 [Daphnia pulicaria]
MVSCMMRQSDEKHILGTASTEILLWSSRRDLIAVSNSSGEVFLRRLSWSKVWKLSKRGDGVKVTAIVWRPDSVILAVGYSSGHVVLVDVESGEVVHTFNPCEEPITALSWENCSTSVKEEADNFLLPELLPQPLKVNSSKLDAGSALDGDKGLKHEELLSILWIGLKNGLVYGFAFGLFPCCLLKLSEMSGGSDSIGPVRSVFPNGDHSQLCLLADVRAGSSEVLLMTVETPLITHCLKELYGLGFLYRQITGLMDCLISAQKALQEAWEDALVDLESKMVRYESNDGKSSLSVDLMELLMFGHAGIKLEKFLVTDLTDKGLKRIGQAVELSYSNMQKLLIKHIVCANYQLSHYLTQLCGLAKQEDRFSCLGLQVNSCLAAYRAAGSFTAKTAELQQVIDGSVKYLKTFFRWLYVTILRLSDEPIPPELATSTQQDVRFIANFLAKDFETDGQVRLDRIGQYLRNEPLTFVASSKTRPWDMLIEACPSIANLQDSDLFQPRAERSLAQEFAHLEHQVKASFEAIPSAVGQTASLPFITDLTLDCPSDSLDKIRITTRSINQPKDRCNLLGLTNSTTHSSGFYLFEFASEKERKNLTRAAFFSFGKCDHLPPGEYKIADLQFYNNEIMSVLLSIERSTNSIFVQLSLCLLREHLAPVVQGNLRSVDVNTFIEASSFRVLNDFQATTLGLSSSRKVAAIFSSSKRKVRIFDMEVEEEEDVEDEDQDIEDVSDLSHDISKDGGNQKDISDVDMAVSP